MQWVSSPSPSTAALCLLLMASTAALVISPVSGQTAQSTNDRPIIGVLAEEIAWSLLDRYEEQEPFSHIAASYVKFVEGGGARPVPIWIGRPKEYYQDIMMKVNG